jgi:hypothetical protein
MCSRDVPRMSHELLKCPQCPYGHPCQNVGLELGSIIVQWTFWFSLDYIRRISRTPYST